MTWYFIDQHDQRYVGNYDLGELKTDEFYLDVTFSSFHEEVFMYYLNEQCVGCPYLLKPFTNATPLATNLKLKLAKTYQNLLPQDETGDVVCNLDYPFGQFGVYRVKNGSDGCEINVVKEAVNIYTQIYEAISSWHLLRKWSGSIILENFRRSSTFWHCILRGMLNMHLHYGPDVSRHY
ncbi:unnamed protein product [Acanthoscelides obtectus]|uniref:Uncharacterized protein n=1 Tax=Acanthoscelides obtectus TaxID=200917 RepID=A0A9P0JNS6_ACAOB|nr:unnamed protein product [Acanthoscelides obtectus]CAK1673681.1 hypothetical protein AOBTE_LOCUS29413 [Acanthoscelides obtectus]